MIGIIHALYLIGAVAAIGCQCPSAEQESPVAPALGCTEASPCIGEATFFDTATSMSAPSACGTVGSDQVVALSAIMFNSADSADRDLCGQQLKIKYNGTIRDGRVEDKCLICTRTAIDLSRSLFSEFADFGVGRLRDVEWWFDDST
jgi:hypothetical protein